MVTMMHQAEKLANVLLVDDRSKNLLALEESLQGIKANFVRAYSGAEALKQLLWKEFAVILLDIQMPGMDGFETAKLIRQRQRNRHVPIIFLTAVYNSDDFVTEGYSLGAVDYLIKPVSPEVLIAKVAGFIQLFEDRQRLEQQTAKLETTSQQWHRLSDALGEQLQQRNAELQQALKFELTLKHITDKVRDRLDESQILQAAVQELTIALKALGCNASLYDTTDQTATVSYEYSIALPIYQGRILQMQNSPELYEQLQQQQSFQFCSLFPNPERGRVASFVCPIQNGDKTIGDLWLINPEERALNLLEARLVEEVAGQCGIGIRQAHLYQAAQAHVQDLEKLSQLKDDFLSTISHELRTPLTAMKMAIQMLEVESIVSEACRSCLSYKPNKAAVYLDILRQECDRESKLLGDLLLLQHLEAGTQPLTLVELRLQDWLPHVLEPFEVLMQQQCQTLQVQIPTDLPPVKIDTFSLKHLLTELLTNAHKYTPAGEQVTVTVQLSQTPALQIAVMNSGVEIPADQQAQIFDKFYRVPSADPWKHGGMGLGLALVKRLAEYLGGTVQVSSAQEFTCFTVTLPPTAPAVVVPSHLGVM